MNMNAHRRKKAEKNRSLPVAAAFFLATSDHVFMKAVRNPLKTRRKNNFGQMEESPIMPQPRKLTRNQEWRRCFDSPVLRRLNDPNSILQRQPGRRIQMPITCYATDIRCQPVFRALAVAPKRQTWNRQFRSGPDKALTGN